MIVCVALILALLLARVCLRAKGKTPLNREELLRMRRYWERIHREEVLPFE